MNRKAFIVTSGGLIATGVGAAAYGRFVEPGRVEYTSHRVHAGIPPFAQLSDLHLRDLAELHEEIADKMRRRQLEFILFTGDSIDRTKDLPLLAEFLDALPSIPKYAILGNWEYWGGVDQAALRRTFERANGRLLVNESVLHEEVALCGLDDFVAGHPDIARATDGLSSYGARVLLAHCPGQRDAERIRTSRFDLMLSGHTHGGQVRPFGWAPVRPQGSGHYVSGWYRENGPEMYVSRGIGTSVLPIRFGARPEVVFFN